MPDPSPSAKLRALVVEDDEDFRATLEALVQREGFETVGAGTLEAARKALAEHRPEVALIDLQLPDGSGLALREEEAANDADLVVVTGHASVDSAVDALREGVVDYLTKPVDRARLKAILAHVARTRGLRSELSDLRAELLELGRFGPMVGRSKVMREVYDLVARVAPTDATVLLAGESGTGKELAAETIHRLSTRRRAAFVPLNCGAVSPNLIESEIFGHEKGSFTGADRQHPGVFERAHGGTLLLDEITEMPAELQVKLLRVLETGTIHRVGGKTGIDVDVRVVAATNRDPHEAVESGALREDLYYRLNVFPIAMPPLRERGDDVELLAEHFLTELNRGSGAAKRWSAAGLRRLRGHAWRGNVRELRNAVQRAFILADEEIGADAVPVEGPGAEPADDTVLHVKPGTPIADVERRLILTTLDHFDGDKKRAAKALGISLKTLYNRLNVYEAAAE